MEKKDIKGIRKSGSGYQENRISEDRRPVYAKLRRGRPVYAGQAECRRPSELVRLLTAVDNCIHGQKVNKYMHIYLWGIL